MILSRRIFGQAGDENATNQLVPETVGTTVSRAFRGPRATPNYSIHVVVGAGGTGSLTVWRSDLPEPDPANDDHWAPDSTIAAIDLAVPGSTFVTRVDDYPEWVRIKAAATAPVPLVVWARTEADA